MGSTVVDGGEDLGFGEGVASCDDTAASTGGGGVAGDRAVGEDGLSILVVNASPPGRRGIIGEGAVDQGSGLAREIRVAEEAASTVCRVARDGGVLQGE